LATVLDLVNRLRRRHRFGDVTSIGTDSLSLVLLDSLNKAMFRIMEGWDWEEDKKFAGVLKTYPELTSTTGTVTNGSTGMTFGSAITVPDAFGAASLRVVVTDDTTYGGTSHRITFVTDSSGGEFTIDTEFEGTTNSGSAELTIFAVEYPLPTNVRKVISMRHQERDMKLVHVSREEEFDRIIPTWHDSIQDEPRIATVGGLIRKTRFDGEAAQETTGALIWPPSENLQYINYTHYSKYAEQTSGSGTFPVEDRTLQDLIVDLAYAESLLMKVGNDMEAGERRKAAVLRDAEALNRSERNMRERIELDSQFASDGAIRNFGRFPKDFGELPT
jgi:hypothetical protein